MYNHTPFISIYQGRNVSWVQRKMDSDVNVTIDGNKMHLEVKKNKTGSDRILETSWAQWDNGYTGVPDITLLVHQKGHDS